MSTSRPDADRLLEVWLADGIDTAPPRAVRSALERVSVTRQRRELTIARRFQPMDAIAPLQQRSMVRFALLAAVSVVAVVAVAFAAGLLSTDAQPAAPVEPARAELLVAGLPNPAGTQPRAMTNGIDALAVLAARSRVAVFTDNELKGTAESISTVTFDGLDRDDQREYTATAIHFSSTQAAERAMRTIRAGLRLLNGQWAQGNSPFIDEHLPAGRDEGLERSGTYLAFGGTSAGASSRVGHMNVWRVGDVVFVAVGVDWETSGTPDYQALIEDGVIALSDALTARAR